MKRPVITALTAIIAVALAGGSILYFKRLSPAKAAVSAPNAAVPVVASTVSGKDVPIYLRGIGTVIAYNTDVVRSQIQGQLVKITFKEGQTVKAGDLLAESIRPSRNQRLSDKLPERIDDLIGLCTPVARHCKRALQRELAGENGQAPQRRPLALVDQA